MFFGCVVISELYLFQEITQSNNWNIKFSIIYLKCSSSCLCCIHLIISPHFSNYWYFQYYILWPWQIKFYFTGNQWQIQKSPKLLKYLNWLTTSVSNVSLSSGVLPIIFVLNSKDLLVTVLLLFVLLPSPLFSIAESFISSL